MPGACRPWECRDEQHSVYINQAAGSLADVKHASSSLIAINTVPAHAENKRKVSVGHLLVWFERPPTQSFSC